MTGFPIIKLEEVADIFSGFAFKSKDLQDFGIPVIKIKNVNNKKVSKNCDQFFSEELLTSKLERYFLKKDDVLVAMTGQGSLGRVGKMVDQTGSFLVNQRVGVIRPKEKDGAENYLYAVLALDTYETQLFTIGLGAGQPNVSAKDIGGLDIPYPDIDVRNRIAGIRLSYDNLIENNNLRIAILEDMAQSLYKEWFVKFRFPGHHNTKFKESSLGLIPEGWGVKRLDDFVVLQRGFDLPKNKRNEEGGVPIYASSGICGFHDIVKVKGPGIVTGRSGTLGIVTLILEDFWALNTTLWVKEFKSCSAFYGYYILSGIGLENYNSGAAVPTLNRNYIHGLPVVSPLPDLIDEFERYAGDNFKAIDLLKRKNDVLRNQRDLLLPKLISGYVDFI